SNFLKMLGLSGSKPGEALGAAALQAHELAKLLRDPRLGFTAYVLHTRTSSIVTVGGFNALNDAEMQRVQRQLAALRFTTNNQQPAGPGRRVPPPQADGGAAAVIGCARWVCILGRPVERRLGERRGSATRRSTGHRRRGRG